MLKHNLRGYAEPLGDVSGPGKLRIAPSLKGALKSLRMYGRYLRTSEAIGNYHAMRSAPE
jgi:hypothetical protein